LLGTDVMSDRYRLSKHMDVMAVKYLEFLFSIDKLKGRRLYWIKIGRTLFVHFYLF
jgi:hypothetical protein